MKISVNDHINDVFKKYSREIGLFRIHRDATTHRVTIRTEFRAPWQFKVEMLKVLGQWGKNVSFLTLTPRQIEQMKYPTP